MQTLQFGHATVNICRDKLELAARTAEEFAALIERRLARSGSFTVALSGGSTPALLYERLLQDDFRQRIPWDKIHFFVSDERCIPAESEENNFGQARRLLLEQAGVPEKNMHPTTGQENDPARAARDYENLLRELFGVAQDQRPRFDLIFLGMGLDGHCASLFPDSPALHEGIRLVVENYVEKLKGSRITFTFPLINHADNIIFMVDGQEKAEVLADALQCQTVKYPVQHIVPEHGKLQWFVEQATARFLAAGTPS